MDTRKVTLAAPYERDGRQYKADDTVELPLNVAANLLYLGLAREPEAKPAPKATKATETKEA